MDISTQHCVEHKAKVSSFLFRGVGHISYILLEVAEVAIVALVWSENSIFKFLIIPATF